MNKLFLTMAFAMACLLVCPAVAQGSGNDGQLLNHPLDMMRPVEVKKTDCFKFDGMNYKLDSLHFLLDATLSDDVVKDNPFVFNNFKIAVEHLVDGTDDNPMVLYIAPNVYWVDDPLNPDVVEGVNGHEPFGMVVRCQNLHLIGLTYDAKNVVLASQRGQTQGAVGNFTMFDFHGDGLQVKNLTMGNYCNVDLDYPLSPSLSHPKRSATITQAHVAYCHGDRVVARNVRFISRLNMNPLNGARRILFDSCHFECTDDALTGNGVYVHCDFDFFGQKPFYTTHPAGAVMMDCDFNIKGNSHNSYFCKASGPVTLVDCRFHAPAQTYVGWTAYPSSGLRCYYSNVTMNGMPYLVEQKHPETSVCLDGLPLLSAFKENGEYNVCGLLAGDDGWIPDGYGKKASVPSQCTALKIVANVTTVVGSGEKLRLEAKQMLHAGFVPYHLQPVTWKIQDGHDGFLDISPNGETCWVSSCYDGDSPVDVLVTASTPSGLQSAIMIRVEGKPLPEPSFKMKPKISIDGNKANVVYALSPDDHGDSSVITWLVSDSKDMANALPLATTHSVPERDFSLQWFMKNKWIGAVIAPRHARSPLGKEQFAIYPKRIGNKHVAKERVLETDFHDFSCKWQTVVKEGCWTVDGNKPDDTAEYHWTFDMSKPMWTYDKGFNGAVGMGLLQAQRGARIRFTPPKGNYGGMVVKLDVDPTKTAGQGFGSATGQYMDIGLKFDNHTLSGYALRIIRTTKYANAVDFLLVRYDNGKVTPLTEPVSAICYVTGCHIIVDFHNGMLTADVHTDKDLKMPDDTNLKDHVHLSAPVEGNLYGGFLLQHTGSCGESTTMLHKLRIEW